MINSQVGVFSVFCWAHIYIPQKPLFLLKPNYNSGLCNAVCAYKMLSLGMVCVYSLKKALSSAMCSSFLTFNWAMTCVELHLWRHLLLHGLPSAANKIQPNFSCWWGVSPMATGHVGLSQTLLLVSFFRADLRNRPSRISANYSAIKMYWILC